MAAYMWNGLQPVTSFTLIPNPNPWSLPDPLTSRILTLTLTLNPALTLTLTGGSLVEGVRLLREETLAGDTGRYTLANPNPNQG